MIPLRILWRATPGWLKAALAGAVVVATAFGGGYALGGRDARLQAGLDAAERYRDTLERMNDAGLDTSDPGAVLDRLRDLAK